MNLTKPLLQCETAYLRRRREMLWNLELMLVRITEKLMRLGTKAGAGLREFFRTQQGICQDVGNNILLELFL